MSRIDLNHIATLSKLNLTDEELTSYSAQLNETVEYVQNLQELDTNDIVPTSSPIGGVNIYFEDGTPNTRALAPSDYAVNRIM